MTERTDYICPKGMEQLKALERGEYLPLKSECGTGLDELNFGGHCTHDELDLETVYNRDPMRWQHGDHRPYDSYYQQFMATMRERELHHILVVATYAPEGMPFRWQIRTHDSLPEEERGKARVWQALTRIDL